MKTTDLGNFLRWFFTQKWGFHSYSIGIVKPNRISLWLLVAEIIRRHENLRLVIREGSKTLKNSSNHRVVIRKNPLQVTSDLQRVFLYDHSVIWQIFWFAKLFNDGGLTTIAIWECIFIFHLDISSLTVFLNYQLKTQISVCNNQSQPLVNILHIFMCNNNIQKY